MSKKFIITAENNPNRFYDFAFKNEARIYSFDFSPWAEDNSTVTAVTVTIKAGSATAGAVPPVSSNVATFLLTTSDVNGVLLEIKATAGTEVYICYLDIIIRDPQDTHGDDYD
jgi:hypothetical protein